VNLEQASFAVSPNGVIVWLILKVVKPGIGVDGAATTIAWRIEFSFISFHVVDVYVYSSWLTLLCKAGGRKEFSVYMCVFTTKFVLFFIVARVLVINVYITCFGKRE
jgi:hypothetical protein